MRMSARTDGDSSGHGIVDLKSGEWANEVAAVLMNHQGARTDDLTEDTNVSFQVSCMRDRVQYLLHDCGKEDFLRRIQGVIFLRVNGSDLGSVESMELDANRIDEFQKVPTIVVTVGDGTMRLNLTYGIQQAVRNVEGDLAATFSCRGELFNEETIEISHDGGVSVFQV